MRILMLLKRYLTLSAVLSIVVLPPAVHAATHDIEVLRDITYATPANTPCRLDVYRPLNLETPAPTILIVHGGFWMEGHGDRTEATVQQICEWFATQGYAAIAIDYRLAPTFTFPAPLEDVRAAACWARDHADRYGFDAQHMIAFGMSAGAQLAALVALEKDPATPPVCGVVEVCGPMDLTATPPNFLTREVTDQILTTYLGASKDKDPQRYTRASPVTYVTPQSPPFMIVHGTADQVVPYSQAVTMATTLQQAHVSCTQYPLAGVGHDIPGPPTPEGQQILLAIQAFVDQCVSGRETVVQR